MTTEEYHQPSNWRSFRMVRTKLSKCVIGSLAVLLMTGCGSPDSESGGSDSSGKSVPEGTANARQSHEVERTNPEGWILPPGHLTFRHEWLAEYPIEDDDAERIARLKNATKIIFMPDLLNSDDDDIYSTARIDDDDVRQVLKYATNVKVVILECAQITDAVLEVVGNLKYLEYLDLSFTKVGDQGLMHLGKLQHLDSLLLIDTNVTSDGLRHLKSLKRLEFLKLNETRVGDQGLGHFQELESLRRLSLFDTAITDEGIEKIKMLTQLESLDISGTEVSEDAVKSLKEELPDLEVIKRY